MKHIVLIAAFLFNMQVFCQKQEPEYKTVNVNSLEVKVDSIAEINTINWNDVKEAFKENNPESDIYLKVSFKKQKRKNIKMSYSYKVDGKAKEIDSLILKLKKGVKLFKKISNK